MYVDFTELKNNSDPHARSSAFYKLAVECKNLASQEMLEKLQAQGVRQADIAAVCGISRSGVSRFFSGELGLPTKSYYTICKNYFPGISLHELLFGEKKTLLLPVHLSALAEALLAVDGPRRREIRDYITSQWDTLKSQRFDETPEHLFSDRCREVADMRGVDWTNLVSYDTTNANNQPRVGQISPTLQSTYALRMKSDTGDASLPWVTTVMMFCVEMDVSADFMLAPDYTGTGCNIAHFKYNPVSNTVTQKMLSNKSVLYAIRVYLCLPRDKQKEYYMDIMQQTGAL